jgi:hypothetical protein
MATHKCLEPACQSVAEVNVPRSGVGLEEEFHFPSADLLANVECLKILRNVFVDFESRHFSNAKSASSK